MTDKEYEQKKRECWVEFKNEVFNGKIPFSVFGAFDFAFDRAYSLGKQPETISQEDVEKAWQGYAQEIGLPDSLNYATKPMIEIAIKQAFKAGAKLNGKQEKDTVTVIQGWVCRDKELDKSLFASDLYLSAEKPKRDEYCGAWTNMGAYMPLNTELFPDLTWDSDPLEVEIVIKRNE